MDLSTSRHAQPGAARLSTVPPLMCTVLSDTNGGHDVQTQKT
nr:MAG TPA: hypothetical protein [Microviridae sp.]